MSHEQLVKRAVPGPSLLQVFGWIARLRRNTLETACDIHAEFGPVVRLGFGPWLLTYFICKADDIEHVVCTNAKHYDKQTVDYKELRLGFGNGLVTSEGDFWRRQRRMIQPAFHREHIAEFARKMTDAARDQALYWQDQFEEGAVINVFEEMGLVTQRIVTETLFGGQLSKDQAQVIGTAIGVAMDIINRRSLTVFKAPFWLPTPNNLRLRRASNSLKRALRLLIAQQRQRGEESNLLSLLLHARDEESGRGMSDAQLMDELITLFTAGQETTANALTWSWLLLAQNPEVQERLHEELDSILGGRAATIDDIPKLTYTDMFLQESMRRYPPVPLISRNTLGPDILSGYPIPANSRISFTQYTTHHDSEYWDDPFTVRPERFAEEEIAKRPALAYYPFLAGPRQCIGKSFAMMELVLILATLAQNFRFETVAGRDVELDVSITLRPKHGLWMKFLRRTRSE